MFGRTQPLFRTHTPGRAAPSVSTAAAVPAPPEHSAVPAPPPESALPTPVKFSVWVPASNGKATEWLADYTRLGDALYAAFCRAETLSKDEYKRLGHDASIPAGATPDGCALFGSFEMKEEWQHAAVPQYEPTSAIDVGADPMEAFPPIARIDCLPCVPLKETYNGVAVLPGASLSERIVRVLSHTFKSTSSWHTWRATNDGTSSKMHQHPAVVVTIDTTPFKAQPTKSKKARVEVKAGPKPRKAEALHAGQRTRSERT